MDVIGFGALNVDKIYRVNKIPREEEESFVRDLRISCGGSAANTIVGLSRLGVRTGYIGKVGDDPEGELVVSELKREGVDVRNIVRCRGRTGCAMVFVDDFGNRAIVLDPGVNDTIRFDEIDLDYVSRFRILHLTSFVCRNSDDSLKSQIRLSSEFDGMVSFDPGSVYAEMGMGRIGRIIENTDVFMPNSIEIEKLTGLGYEEGAEEILGMGVKIVVVKLGANGCYITDGRRRIRVPAYSVNPVDTTGAGDAFNAGFLYGLLRGRDLEECGRIGNYVASLCIQKVGAREGLPKSIPERI